MQGLKLRNDILEIMKKLLYKLKLIDYLTTELEIEKSDFVNKFCKSVDEKNINISRYCTSRNKEYIGKVSNEGFEIVRRKLSISRGLNSAKVKGSFSYEKNKLIIKSEINIFYGPYIIVFIVFTILNLIFISIIILGKSVNSFLIVFFLMFFLQYFFMFFQLKRNLQRVKYDIERELYYTTKK